MNTVAPTAMPAVAALTGILRIPAKIISDHGGGILSNNGASIIVQGPFPSVISDNGGGYRLAAAPTQLPVAKAKVELVDAAGQVLAAATTDDAGRYAFASVPSGHNYLLAATLGKAGTLQAVVPPGAKQVDTDLVSTLTTAYILDQYVKGDPKVLDKLPADVEADTRAKAAVASLRKADATFDAQMETVKRLLLVAGQSNNGVGRKALDVAFKGITQLGYGPDGLLYVLAPYDRRLYRIDADGYLQIVAGSGTEDAKSQEGKPLDQADLGYLDQVILAKDGFVLLDQVGSLARISRAGADGVLHELARQQGTGPNPPWDGIASLPDGGWAILADDGKGNLLFADQDARQIRQVPAAVLAE